MLQIKGGMKRQGGLREAGMLPEGEEPGTAEDRVVGGRMETSQVTQHIRAEPRFERRVI